LKLHIRQLTNWGFFVALILLIVSVLQIPAPPGYTRAAFRFICECGIVLLLASFIYQKVNKWVGLFLGLTLLSSIYPAYTKYSLLARNAVIFWCLWYSLLVLTVKKERALLNVICIIALINVGFQMLQFFNIDPVHKAIDGGHDLPTGLLSNINQTSALLAFCFPAFLRKQWKWGIFIVLLGLVLAKSTGGVVAVSIGVLFYGLVYFWGAWKKIIIISLILAGCFLIFLLLIDRPSCSNRLDKWIIGLKLLKNRVIFGFGIGHWGMLFAKLSNTNFYQAHNDLLQGLWEMGIGFIVILAGYLIDVIKRAKHSMKEHILPLTALVIILVNSMVNFPFHVATTAIIAVSWMAILQIRSNKERRHECS